MYCSKAVSVLASSILIALAWLGGPPVTMQTPWQGDWARSAHADVSLPAPSRFKPGEVRRDANGRLVLRQDAMRENGRNFDQDGAASGGEGQGIREHRVCPPGERGDCHYSSIADALKQTRTGDVLVLLPGVYNEAMVVRTDRLTIRAPGAHIKDAAAGGKGAVVIYATDVTIEGLECSGIKVRDRNGACVRLHGRNLTLRNVYFHDSEEGLLAANNTGTVLIEDSRFERLGQDGQAHGMYINHSEALILRRNRIVSSRSEGHEVKSRAERTVIEDNVIASLGGGDSRLIDVPNGGEVIIRRNVLQEGRGSVNEELIGVGLEGIKRKRNTVLIEGNTIIIDRPRAILLRSVVPVEMNDNVVIGGKKAAKNAPWRAVTPVAIRGPLKRAGQLTGSGNVWYPDRAAAGLAPYPALPPSPLDVASTR